MFIRFLSAALCLLVILASCSNEPEPIPTIPTLKATITGKVRDTDTGEPIYYATIFTVPPSTEIRTGIDGNFILSDIWPKDYMVYSYPPGFDNDSVFVSLNDGDTANVNMYLNNFSEYLDYYPLDIGNYWEYWTGETPTYSIEIVADTIINNTLYYVSKFKMVQNGNYTKIRYDRLDTYNAIAYRIITYDQDEVLIDSLPAKVGQTFKNSMLMDWDGISYCWSIENEDIFGELRSVRSLSYLGHEVPSYKIVKGIGLYSFGRFSDENILKYAIIKGVEYGER